MCAALPHSSLTTFAHADPGSNALLENIKHRFATDGLVTKKDLHTFLDECNLSTIPRSGSKEQIRIQAYRELSNEYQYCAQVGLRLEVELPRGASSELMWFGGTVAETCQFAYNDIFIKFDAHPDLPYSKTLRTVIFDSSEWPVR